MDVKNMSVEQLQEFARRDDCLDQMVPSDLRQIIGEMTRRERVECQKAAAMYGGKDAEAIAELIGQRSFKNNG